MYVTTYKFSRSQDEWECDLNLTYPRFKLNGLRTTGPSTCNSFMLPDKVSETICSTTAPCC